MNKDEAIQVIRSNFPTGRNQLCEALETLIPELKESEDERIIRTLKEIANWGCAKNISVENNVELKDCLAWLEKQGYTDSIIEKAKTEKQRVIITETDGNANIDWDTRSLEDARELLEYGLQYINTELEKQGEKKQGKTPIWNHWKDGIAGNGEGKLIYLIKKGNSYSLSSCLGYECDYILLSDLDKLMLQEKQGEQKPVDKVELKFKTGDWIVYCNEDVDLITGIEDSGYLINKGGYIPFTSQGDMRYWEIQDAKEGDVLAFYSEYKGNRMVQVGIIKKYVGKHGGCSNTFNIYVGVNWDNNLQIDEYMGCSDIRPATKEQRDLLFVKLKEAGYEWDVEKKELKKIEQKPAWSEENICYYDDICEILINLINSPKSNVNKDVVQKDLDWLRSVKESQLKPAWSEEDENLYNRCMSAIQNRYNDGLFTTNEYRQTSLWLKSLKERVQSQSN